MVGVVSLSVKKSVVDDDKRRNKVDEFARRQHAQISSDITTSVAVAIYTQTTVKEVPPIGPCITNLLSAIC